IHVWTNADVAPPGTDGLVGEALDSIADATGLVFVDEGATSAAVIQDLPERTDGWRTDVIIVWATPEDEPDLAGDTAGMGGSLWWRDPDWYEGGSILLDAPQLADILDHEGTDAVLAVIMHEVAHVVGLGHVDDPLELMHPQARRGVLTFGP